MIQLIGIFMMGLSLLGQSGEPPLRCVEDSPGAIYYAIDLVTTKNVPGTGAGIGTAVVSFKANPFGVSISKDGSYQHDLLISLKGINKPKKGPKIPSPRRRKK